MQKFKNVNKLVDALKPDYPVYCIRPEAIKISTDFFKKNFPGKVLYAVKTNPNEDVLKHIISNGIEHFDVASISEIKLIKKLKPEAKLYFMHTVKSRENITEAYFKFGVRNFALDTKDELQKILESTKQAKDLNIR
jgi:ornithine decarboxylase